MEKVNFTKMVASGNDFIVVCQLAGLPVSRLKKIALKLCNRKYGIGADGLLLLEKSKVADIKMRIFNVDGSEAQMCGNGARCAALYISHHVTLPVRQAGTSPRHQKHFKIETKAGIVESEVGGDNVSIRLTDPKGIKLGIPLKINGRLIKVNFINTGVPHAVIFVEGLDKIDIARLGRQIRYHKKFAPAGTNADFVEVINNNSISVRTYERGVEDETLACGTGSAASALLAVYSLQLRVCSINVYTKSGEVLKVSFDRAGNNFRNVWLEGPARIVYKGEYDV